MPRRPPSVGRQPRSPSTAGRFAFAAGAGAGTGAPGAGTLAMSAAASGASTVSRISQSSPSRRRTGSRSGGGGGSSPSFTALVTLSRCSSNIFWLYSMRHAFEQKEPSPSATGCQTAAHCSAECTYALLLSSAWRGFLHQCAGFVNPACTSMICLQAPQSDIAERRR